jgi:hypothetical protein
MSCHGELVKLFGSILRNFENLDIFQIGIKIFENNRNQANKSLIHHQVTRGRRMSMHDPTKIRAVMVNSSNFLGLLLKFRNLKNENVGFFVLHFSA